MSTEETPTQFAATPQTGEQFTASAKKERNARIVPNPLQVEGGVSLESNGRPSRHFESPMLSQSLFEAEAETSPDGIVAIDDEGRVMLCNRRFRDLWRLPNETSTTFEDSYLVDRVASMVQDREAYLGRLDYFKSHRDESGVDEIVLKDRRVMERFSAPLRSVTGTYLGRIAYFRDISERKLLQEELRASERKHRELAESISDVFFAMDRDLRYTYWNKACERLTGISSDQALGKRMTDMFPDSQSTRAAIAAHRRAIHSGQPQSLTMEYPGGGGRIHDINAYPTEEGVSVLVRDVTDRVEAEERVRSERENYLSSLDASPLGVMIVNNRGDEVYANEAFLAIWGYRSLEELKVAPLTSRLDSKTVSWIRRLRSRRARGVRLGDRSRQVTALRSDGETRSLRIHRTDARWGGERCSLIMCEDVTIQKKAEEKLRVSEGQLAALSEHLNVALEQERGRISRELHDEMGQALTALQIDLHWLSKRLTDGDAGAAERLQHAGRVLDQTVDGVRKISWSLRPAILDDFGLVPAIEWLIQDFEKRSGICSSLSLDGVSPDLDRILSSNLFRIIQEALTNVLKHSGASKVDVRLSMRGAILTVAVRDNGKGITEAESHNPTAFGLIGIEERCRQIGGTFAIKGMKGKGTSIVIRVHVDSSHHVQGRPPREAGDPRSVVD